MARPFAKLTAQIENVIRAKARGEPTAKIIQEYYGISPEDTKAFHNAECKISDLQHRPDYDAIWADELSRTVKRNVPGAINKLCSQIENQNDWLANKAVIDLLNLASKLGAIRNEEQTVNVQISGLPEIGSPDQPEEDG